MKGRLVFKGHYRSRDADRDASRTYVDEITKKQLQQRSGRSYNSCKSGCCLLLVESEAAKAKVMTVSTKRKKNR